VILELAFMLDKDINYYIELLKKENAINVFCCETHDIYYTNKSNRPPPFRSPEG
jgi:hypothetical protein